MRKGLAIAVGCAVAFGIPAGVAQAATVIYTSESSFQTAAAPTTLETFDGGVSSLLTIDSGSGLFTGNAFEDIVFRNDDEGTVINFAYDVLAFGGVFKLSLDGFGHGLRFSLLRDSGEEAVGTVLARRDGFFGFTSTEAFSAIRITWSGSKYNAKETYGLDDVLITAAPLVARGAPVSGAPEPTTWALMLAGFGSAGVALRRRREASSAVA